MRILVYGPLGTLYLIKNIQKLADLGAYGTLFLKRAAVGVRITDG